MKFISSGSFNAATAWMASSTRLMQFWKLSRRMPEIFTVTSILGLPSSSKGIIRKERTLPFGSHTGSTPSIYRSCAMPSPSAHIISVVIQ